MIWMIALNSQKFHFRASYNHKQTPATQDDKQNNKQNKSLPYREQQLTG